MLDGTVAFDGFLKGITYPHANPEAAKAVWADRYAMHDPYTGDLLENDFSDTAKRVATAISNGDHTLVEPFYEALDRMELVPGGRIYAAAGLNTGEKATLSNCFVVPIEDSREGITRTMGWVFNILSKGGGVGVNFSPLRQRGAVLQSSRGQASGPCSFITAINALAHCVNQGGSRRGAMMGQLSVDHPDILQFVHWKANHPYEYILDDPDDIHFKAGAWEHLNVSVQITDNFVARLKKHERDAEEIWEHIAHQAWASGDPGLFFIDRVNHWSNAPYAPIICSNPSMPAGTLVGTDRGIVPIETLEGERFLVKSLDGAWAPAQCFLSGEDEEIIEFELGQHKTTHSTKQHRWPVLAPDGSIRKIDASEIRVGDLIPLNRNEATGINVNPDLTEEEGFFVGYLFGDGWVSRRANGALSGGIVFHADERPLAERLLRFINANKARPSSIKSTDAQLVIQFTDQSFLTDLVERYGLDLTKESLPSVVWRSNDTFVAGFVDGLLSSDGYVTRADADRNRQIVLTSSGKGVAVEFGKLLSFYGVPCSITTRTSKGVIFPNGKSYNRDYQSWRVCIGDGSLAAFASVFTISHAAKRERLNGLLVRTPRNHRASRYAQVTAVRPAGRARVWDISVEHEQHVFPSQWAYTGNCGEQPLPAFGSCNLASINLAALARGGKFDWDRLYDLARLSTTFLDNVLDANEWPLREVEAANERDRRVGTGTVGLADACLALGIKYGDESCLRFVSEVYKTITLGAYRQSVELARTRGSFGGFDQGYYDRPFVRQVRRQDTALGELMARYGVRNVTLTTQAPTGSISQLAGVNGGIEPFFLRAWKRYDRVHPDGVIMLHPKGDDPNFVQASDLSGLGHVRVQDAAQRWTDSAISKTVNLPNEATVEDVKEVYNYAIEHGLKGITVYRDGCRDGISVLNGITDDEVRQAVALKQAEEYAQRFAGATCTGGKCD